MLLREERPGLVLLEHLKEEGKSPEKAKLHKTPAEEVPFLYEFNEYNEVVIHCAIEARIRADKEQAASEEAQGD